MHPESQASATVMPQGEEARAYLEQLATQITYGGNLSTSAILGTSGCNRLANPGRVKPYATK
jgi:hypothetical protein